MRDATNFSELYLVRRGGGGYGGGVAEKGVKEGVEARLARIYTHTHTHNTKKKKKKQKEREQRHEEKEREKKTIIKKTENKNMSSKTTI